MVPPLQVVGSLIKTAAGGAVVDGQVSGGGGGESRTSTTAMGKSSNATAGTLKLHHCTVCQYSTNVTTNLKNHMRIHTGEKPFQCPHCSFCTTQRGSLRTHIRKHTGEKPFSCPHCDYRSVTKGNLNAHMSVHRGESGKAKNISLASCPAVSVTDLSQGDLPEDSSPSIPQEPIYPDPQSPGVTYVTPLLEAVTCELQQDSSEDDVIMNDSDSHCPSDNDN